MSKFLDRLEKINQGAARSLGFGASAQAETLPAMALIGALSNSGKSAKGAANLAKIGADGALVQGGNGKAAIKQVGGALDSVPWGLRVEGLDGKEANSYKEQGCDFLAFGPEKVMLGALGDEDTGYLLCVKPDMDERQLNTVEGLPVDGVLLKLDSAQPPLTIEDLIAIGSVRMAFSKYLLLEMSGVPTARELEALRDIGVNGLVVDADSLPVKKLEELKKRMSSLPKPPKAKSGLASAVLPRMPKAADVLPAQEEEEWDDDE